MPVLRVAVVGCGDISSLHLAAIEGWPDAELVAVCDTDGARLAAAVAATGAAGFADHRALFDEVHPDVVHITTPHAAHADIAVDALDRGIHVVLEKPLAHDIPAGERVAAAAGRSTARVAVCFQNRYNATVQRAHEVLASGELGRVQGAAATVMWSRTAEYYLDRPWRGTWAGGGGGLLMNQAIHTLDLVQWLVGGITEATGSASTRVLGDVIEVEDTAEMVLQHENGARSVFYATLANTTNAPITVDIMAEHGTLSLRGDLTVIRGDGSVEVVTEGTGSTGPRSYWGTSHALLIHDFYRSLGGTDPFWIDAAEALKTLSVIQDIYDQTYPTRALQRAQERSMTS
jgi:UDP-N-acetyl-2-amino-2-deoxyglucuronate dehydrogenase